MSPRGIYICDGSEGEAHEIIQKLMERGTLERLEKLENWLLCNFLSNLLS